jgi:PRTRC genetic system ThiF family protein
VDIDLSADLRPRYRVLLGDVERAEIVLVGCGGTGSFLALHLARLAWHAQAAGLEVALTFVDPDSVEEKNIGRQNFCPAEVGEHKAITLARRYSLAFGLPIRSLVGRLEDVRITDPLAHDAVRIYCGCVDNATGRRAIAAELSNRWASSWRRTWWLDGGNHRDGGQVHLGNGQAVEVSPLGFCSALPSPAVQAPDLVEDPAIEVGELAGLSCAELAALDAQGLMVNQAIAGWMATYLYRLLITRDLDIMATYIDLMTGSARSEPITMPEEEEE